MFGRLLIANRGEIALRIARTARRLGLEVLGAFSSADGGLPHLRLCHRALELPGDPARVYLDIPGMIDAARKLRAEAIHPGYGFLAENEDFAAAVEDAGMAFIGPTPEQIVALGDKVQARQAAERAGLPTVPGRSETVASPEAGRAIAASIGYPVLIKAAAGGGGRGMRVVEDAAQFEAALARAQSEARAAFGDDRVFIEKYIPRARHVEIQILGDGRGAAVSLGDRECSIQRRHQKLIEESPAPALAGAGGREVAEKMGELAAKLAAGAGYRGAGTMEFLVPFGTHEFYFIEMNTRLQVEHPVTELLTGLDLVEEQIAIAQGRGFSSRLVGPASVPVESVRPAGTPVPPGGHAIEARVIAEDPDADFLPSSGKLDLVALPAGPGIRVDGWAEPGLAVSPYYDSLLAKVLAWGRTRDEAIGRLETALLETHIHPVCTTAAYLARLISGADFHSGKYDTGTLARLPRGGGGALPVQAAVLAGAEQLARSVPAIAAPRPDEPRQLSRWQTAGEP